MYIVYLYKSCEIDRPKSEKIIQQNYIDINIQSYYDKYIFFSC